MNSGKYSIEFLGIGEQFNNPYALQEIEKATRISGIPFEGKSVVLKEQVAAFFEVTPHTVDNYIERYGDELRRSGYEVIRDNRLKTLKLEISALGDNETDCVITQRSGHPRSGGEGLWTIALPSYAALVIAR